MLSVPVDRPFFIVTTMTARSKLQLKNDSSSVGGWLPLLCSSHWVCSQRDSELGSTGVTLQLLWQLLASSQLVYMTLTSTFLFPYLYFYMINYTYCCKSHS